MNGNLNLLLFVAIIVLVVSILYSYNNNFITFDTSLPSVFDKAIAKNIDINIPMHVLSNTDGYTILYFVPDGKYDGQSILLLFEKITSGSTYSVQNIGIKSVNNNTYFISNKSKVSNNYFYPFSNGLLSPRALYRMVWYNKSWFIDNDNFD